MRRLALLIFAFSLLAAPATANAATAGGLKQLSGTNRCLSGADPLPSGCRSVRALTDLGDVVVAPDGKNVYATSRGNDAIIIFDRNTSTGVLTQKSGVLGCVTGVAGVASAQTCNLVADPNTMDSPNAIAASSDNKTIYVVTTSGRITGFNRASDGSLTFNDASFYTSQGPLLAVAVSPDGKSVYMAGDNTGVGWYRRNTTPGASLGDIGLCCGQPSHGYQSCFGASCSTVTNYGNVTALEVTPDNKELLVGSSNSTVLGWDRNTSTGGLTPNTTADHCVGATSATCMARSGIQNVQSIAVVDNNKFHIGSQQSISTVSRNPANGALTPDTAGNCFGYPGSSFTNCTPMPGSSPFVWYPARSLVGTPDGRNLYLGTEASTTPGVFSYTRSSSGNIARNPTALSCLNTTATEGCRTFAQGNRIQAMATASNNRHVYGVGDNKLFSFSVDRAPVCSNLSVGTAFQTPTTIGLSCSDPDGDAVTYQVVNGATRGFVAAPQGGAVTYQPFQTTTGADSFTYRAVAAGVASDPATVTVNVGGPVAPPPPPPAVLAIVPSSTSFSSLTFAKFTKFSNLSANNLPAGAKVVVKCKTKKKKAQKKGCPKTKTYRTTGAKKKLNLRKPFRKKRLPHGTKITITITAPNFRGKRITYTTRPGRRPSSRVQCASSTNASRFGSCI
jgi:Bacterial Ig domain/Lactonase, 7-bladed beta-propeller